MGVPYLDNFGNWEKESIRVSSVDCCQLGCEEDQAYNKDLIDCEEQDVDGMTEEHQQNFGINEDLTTHEEPFNVVPFGCYLAEPAHGLNLGFHSTVEFVWEEAAYL